MKYDPQIHHRRSIRLPEYDYSRAGAYFVTICTWGRQPLFGEIDEGVMRLNAAGRIMKAEWKRLANQFANIHLGAFVVMPNHVHGIIVINDPVGATRRFPIDTHSSTEPVPKDALAGTDMGRRTMAMPAPPYRVMPMMGGWISIWAVVIR